VVNILNNEMKLGDYSALMIEKAYYSNVVLNNNTISSKHIEPLWIRTQKGSGTMKGNSIIATGTVCFGGFASSYFGFSSNKEQLLAENKILEEQEMDPICEKAIRERVCTFVHTGENFFCAVLVEL